MPKKIIDLTGQRFGQWIVIKYSHSNTHKQSMWLCRCDCGTEKIVMSGNLRGGNSTNCGCIFHTGLHKTHGMTGTRLFNIWCLIIARCTKEYSKCYSKYGGRGITICEEWKNNFEIFRDWSMDNGYTDKLTIDRINNDGNYEPLNCRWTTQKVQSNNTRQNHNITFNGETHTVSEWSEIVGVPRGTLKDRIRRGWDSERALTEPLRKWPSQL